MLAGKKIVLGVSGSIAAYKAVYLTRLFVEEGAHVQVVMTPDACGFVGPLTFSALSGREVFTSLVQPGTGKWQDHVAAARWADAMVIAPATANTLAKMVQGICDNALLALYLSLPGKGRGVFVAPAMDADMYAHPATAANIAALRSLGVQVIPPETGALASGLTGEGRLAGPETIAATLRHWFLTRATLKGKRALVSAGPTREPIDPVRFIGNQSSGKMGFALAEALVSRGAQVTLISGPVERELSLPNLSRIDVRTAEEMHRACMKHFPKNDITLMCAAVADFTPSQPAPQKIKKNNAPGAIRLTPTADILTEMGRQKKRGQILVGFALETENEITNAHRKLLSKNLDLLVLNSLNDKGAGFGVDTNKITLLNKKKKIIPFGLKSKREAAEDIAAEIVKVIGSWLLVIVSWFPVMV